MKIVHYSHHKCGTKWMNNILGAIARELCLKFEYSTFPSKGTDIWSIEGEPYIDFNTLGDFRGTHMVRDIRDVIVSGYHYHLICNEEHILKGGYQEMLRSLPKDDGLWVDMHRHAAVSAQCMVEWDYKDPRWYNFKYERLWEAEEATFIDLFNWYQLSSNDIKRCLEICKEYTFEKVRDGKHIRKGCPGQWKEELKDFHIKKINEGIWGRSLKELGYPII